MLPCNQGMQENINVNMRSFIILISILFLFAGCNNSTEKTSDLTEGKLEYKIIYPRQLESDGSTTFLPSEMITFFKGDDVMMDIKGGFGLYHLKYISKATGDTCFTLFKLFDKKLYYPMDNKQTLFVFKELGKPRIKLFKDSLKTIAGFLCKKAVISFPKTRIRSINAYYTEEIGREKPNVNTPFEKIPGVLMEFNFFYKTLTFKVVAKKFSPVKVSGSEFNIPSGYKKTTQEEIESFITTLLQ